MRVPDQSMVLHLGDLGESENCVAPSMSEAFIALEIDPRFGIAMAKGPEPAPSAVSVSSEMTSIGPGIVEQSEWRCQPPRRACRRP